jgi:tetratricopeptide (TPR) repeat protein
MRNGAASLEQPEGGAQALAEFQKASEISPSKGDPWAGMGDAYMQMAQYGYSPTMWDKALQNGATLTINACRAGFSCGDTGSFLVSTKEISFINKKGEKEFVAVPSSITSVEAASHGLGSTYYWQLQFQGKKYRFYFGPRGMQCRSNFICPEPGLTQQKIVAEYVHTTVDKLRAGSFGLQQSKP